MWKTILAIIGVVLAVIAVWLLVDMRKNDTRDQFVACKVENVQLIIQYGRCLRVLKAATGQSKTVIESGDPPRDPRPGGMMLGPNPGGMITDPDPGGMITDPDDGSFVAFAPSNEKLEQCAARNAAFRAAVKACGKEFSDLP